MNVEACLPADLRGPTTQITKVSAGLSGAGVYRVEAAGQAFVLKISPEGEDAADWRRKLRIQRLAADAGLAPRIVHVDEERCAILTAFVADRSFPAFYGDPRTREAAVELLGRTVRRLHDLPLPADAVAQDPRKFLSSILQDRLTGFALPTFVGEVIQRQLAEEPPADERAPVLSHNDLNPTNLVYDGERILLLDWNTAGAMHPFFDLAAISVFLRMDEGTCRRLLAAYDGKPVASLPARFVYCRRLAAVLCGTMFLSLARQSGHAGATGGETLESAPSLSDFYQRMRAGALSIATADGQWVFGLALLKEGRAL